MNQKKMDDRKKEEFVWNEANARETTTVINGGDAHTRTHSDDWVRWDILQQRVTK